MDTKTLLLIQIQMVEELNKVMAQHKIILLSFLCAVATFSCKSEIENEPTWPTQEIYLPHATGTFVISNEFGKGYIKLSENYEYEHVFSSQDSTYTIKSKFWTYLDNKDGKYKVGFKNWKWFFPRFEHTKLYEEIICVMIFDQGCLISHFSGDNNPLYYYCSENLTASP